MPERSSKRKARRDFPTISLDEPEDASSRTEDVPSISDKDSSEFSEKVGKSVSRRIKETETNQREILKMMENLSSKLTHYMVKHLGPPFRRGMKPILRTH